MQCCLVNILLFTVQLALVVVPPGFRPFFCIIQRGWEQAAEVGRPSATEATPVAVVVVERRPEFVDSTAAIAAVAFVGTQPLPVTIHSGYPGSVLERWR